MTFRPTNYTEAVNFLRNRKHKDRNWRAVSRDGRQIRDQIIGLTADPTDIEKGACPVAFRQWSTNIAVFHPDGSVEVNGHNSVTTHERMRAMGLPILRELTKNDLGARVHLLAEKERMDGYMGPDYPLGLPGTRVFLIKTPAGWRPDPHLNSFLDTVKIPDIKAKRRFTRSKTAFRKHLRRYVGMVEAMHGEVKVDWRMNRGVESDVDDLCQTFLNEGMSKASVEAWLQEKQDEEVGIVLLKGVLIRTQERTFWDEADSTHFEKKVVDVRDTLQELSHVRF